MAKDFLNKLTDTAKSGLDKTKEIAEQLSDKAKPTLDQTVNQVKSAVDQAKSTTQIQFERMSENPTFEKVQGHISPHLEKAKDGIDSVTGKQLEEKLTEYTDVFSDVLLSLHRRVEEDRSEHERKIQQMKDEIESLKATVQRMQQELARPIKT